MSRKGKFISICFLVMLFSAAKSQDQNIRFDLLSIKNGLSQSSVNAILQDGQGFMWIGTQDGLNKYDGYDFTVYYHDSNDSSSICNNFIRAIVEDEQKNLWIATDFGLSKFDQNIQKFKSFYSNNKNEESIGGDDLRSLAIDQDGLLWAGTASNGFFVFDPKTEKARPVFKEKEGISTLKSEGILAICVDHLNNVWMGTDGGGVIMFDRKSDNFMRFKHQKNRQNSLSGNVAWSIFRDNKNKIWIGTNSGLSCVNFPKKDKEKITFKNFSLKSQDNNQGPEKEVVRSIFQSKDNKLWIGTEGGGLQSIVFDKNTNKYKSERHYNNPLISSSLCDDIVLSVFEDRMGLIWIGTNNGLNKFDPKKQSFKHIRSIPNTKFSLADNTAWSIHEDKEKPYLWVGTRQGLNQIDKKTGETIVYGNISKTSNYQVNKSIMAIYQDYEGTLFVGTVDGIYKTQFDKDNKRIQTFVPVNYCNDFFKKPVENKIYIIFRDLKGFLWVGTKKGLSRLSPDLSDYTYFSYTEGATDGLPNNTVREIIQDSKGTIWIGTEGGLCQVIEKNDSIKFKTYRHNNKVNSISNDLVTSIKEDKNGILWIGTYGGGLNKFDSKNERFKAYTEKEGLSNNAVYGVFADEFGNLWMSTNKGISMFDIESEIFMVYHENDGLQSDEFNIGAYHKNTEGVMYFGGINGISYFHPKDVVKNSFPPQIAFTDFKINNQSVKVGESSLLKRNLNFLSDLTLSYRINNFTFEFASLHYSYPERNQYAYKMVGFDEDWNYIGGKRYAHYTNLDPGEYTFIVKGSNSDGIWSNNVASLKLNITPPFWETWWFRISVSAFVGLFIFLAIRIRINQIKAQKEILEKQVKDRTTEVILQKEQIEKQKNDLQIEKEKTEKLLLNILPEHTVDELKVQGKAKARNYRHVSVMFTDFKGFTGISESLRPQELVEKLDSYFIKFDEIIEKYNVEKVKTIGDAYMCAGGIPIRNKSNPIEVVLAGLEIQNYMLAHKAEREAKGEDFWELRLGIHTGELIAGVIGKKRFAYDIWGDTVNIANRMEMGGEVGKVNISGKTYSFIKSFFDCTYRGKVQAKNKGEVDMYYVTGIIPEFSKDGLGKEPNDVFWDYVDLELYSSINYKKAEKFIVKMLEDGLSPELHYHNLDHMKDVCAAVERIAKAEGIKGEDLFLLKTAALYHDAGFIEEYTNNEPIGARMAKEALSVFGYSEEQLNVIEQLILATKVPQQPKTHLEEIICDADLDYLGGDNFYPTSEGLKKELLAFGIVKNDKHWDEIQIKFLSAHRYFTKSAKQMRSAKKFQRIEEIKKRYEEDNYV